MKARTNNPKAPQYAYYGGRGIVVCDRWLHRFENFLADMGRSPGRGYTIERMDNDGPYSPENCRWATKSEQANNRKTARLLTFQGQTFNAKTWALRFNMSHKTLWQRLKLGWPVEQALTVPVRIQKNNTHLTLDDGAVSRNDTQTERRPCW